MPTIESQLKKLTEELKKRLLPLPAVPSTFKPLKASAAQLAELAYPPRPPTSEKTALKIWKAIVSAPVPPPRWEAQVLPLLRGTVDYKPYFNQPGARGRQETSENWSGVVTHRQAHHPFRVIFGMWVVPEVSAPALAPDLTYSCSTWLGMDGYMPTTFSMPQMGTTQSVVVKKGVATPHYEAWFQWWSRFGFTAPVPFQNLKVRPGDTIACSLEFVNLYEVRLAIANVTLGTPVIRQRLQAPEINIGKWRIPIGFVTGTTAEWVAERPRNLQDDTYLYPLPDFDNVPFTSALVTSTTGSRDFRPARVIRMVECGDEGVEVISRTEVASFPDGTFRVGPGIEAKMGG